MSAEWRDTTWGDIARLEYGKSLRGYQNRSGQFRVYGTNGPIGWTKNALCQHPGVIVGRKGAYRGIHYSREPFFVIDTAFYLEPKEDLDSRWAYYALLTYDINGMDSGSAIPSTSRESFHRLSVQVPPLAEQRAIAHILRTLDDKIDLNRRMNAILEEMARALFKSWFVDFDPVRAKAEERDTGLPREIADLFPDSFEESGLGEIPRGWSVVSLPEAIEVNPTRSLAGVKIAPYLDMASMPTCGHRPDRWIERTVGSGMKFINGDTLLARITPCLENGKTAFVDFLENAQVGWGSTEYIVMRPKPPLPPSFAYYLARTEDLRTFAIQNMTGSSGRQRVPAECLKQFLLVVPSEPVARRFGEVVQGFMDRIRTNGEQCQTLAALRDTLLPKLISGELRVPDAERVVGSTA
jgi:type I restriction enzyme S subunit